MYDLLITGGQVVDPSQGLDAEIDIALSDGKVAKLEQDIPKGTANQVIDAKGLIVAPGLIDLHAHIFEGTLFGVNADTSCLRRGVTTVVDAGSSGAYTYPALRKHIIEHSQTQILVFLNLSGFGLVRQIGELLDLRFADVMEGMDIIESNRDVICGIKTRMELRHVGDNGYEVLHLTRKLADMAQLPIMVHIGQTSPPLVDILEELKPGDVITHTFHARPGGILDDQGHLLPEVVTASERGVIFDVGHGRGSFSFQIARQAIEQGLLPNTISSDLHSMSIESPARDLVTTMSKFLYLGFTVNQIISMTTWKPAQIIHRDDEIGTLRQGAIADITFLDIRDEPTELSDACMDIPTETVTASEHFVPVGVIHRGDVIYFEN